VGWHHPALATAPWGPGRAGTRRPPAGPRPGRRPLADEVLAEAAAAYVVARARGSQRPVPDAATAASMTEARMRDLIYRARRRGFLPPTHQGRGGGDLTAEGRALLRKTAKGRALLHKIRSRVQTQKRRAR
jgi:hypothetical protein